MIIIGIDPGHTGAVAFYRPSDEQIRVFDMPLAKALNEGKKNTVYPNELARLVKKYTAGTECFAVLEKVSAMTYVDSKGQRRGQGAKSSFTFGASYGVVVGVLGALGVTTYEVHSSVWKTLMLLSRDKKLSIEMAKRKFPSLVPKLQRAKDDGRAEAALLAFFGKRFL